ncbi:hypothetical protein LCGC14_0377000 [marine sediment metagenome]|uniref:Uncharacterized protein n=1 Tax=marine sediment metagenome TaxID=412755 RepID=A0A0F9T9H7_9ZZZZ
MAKKRITVAKAKIYPAVNVHVESIRANCPLCGRVLTQDGCMVIDVNLGYVRCGCLGGSLISIPHFAPKNVDTNERFETWDD